MIKTDDKNVFIPKKRLGQNFLINTGVQEKIIASAQLNTDDTVLEIGAGKGALTHRIASKVKALIAVEKDNQLVQYLKNEIKAANVRIIHDDILTFPLENISGKIKIIGNLPYSIATPIIERVIAYRNSCDGFYFMVQKEYADRLAAKVNTKAYGALSCFIQYYADVKILFRIKPGSFRPAPKVQSAFLQCLFLKKPSNPAKNEKHLFKLIQRAFQQRRKTLENALDGFVRKECLRQTAVKLPGIDLKKRAGEITLSEFVALSNELISAGD